MGMHDKRIADDERNMRDQAESKIEDARRDAEDDSELRECQDKADKLAEVLREEEDKLLNAKKKLENLTGEPVKEPRAPPRPPRAPPSPEERDVRRPAPTTAPPAEEEPEYEYSEYSEDLEPVGQAPPPRPAARLEPRRY